MAGPSPAASRVAPDPDGTTTRDGVDARAVVARFLRHWTVTERTERPGAGDKVRRHLAVEPEGAVAAPAFRLDRHERAVVLSECDDTGAWTLGWFGSLADALAMPRREARAYFAEADGAPAPDRAEAV